VSLKDLFSKEGRKDRALQKNCAKAADKKIKPEDRRPALYALLDDGSDEAIAGLLKRLTFNYDTNSVNDEEEKDQVYEGLVQMGERILPILKRHLHTSPTLSWGLRIVHEICDHEATWGVLEEILHDYEPGYERDPTKKIQLMNFLGEFKDERAVKTLIPFLEDQDETVRFVTIEALLRQKGEEARDPLLKVLTNEEEESLRIKHRIAEGFAELGWQVKGFRGTVEKLLASAMSEFIVDGKGRIRLKKAKPEVEE
jgi:hypothetical protein